MYCFDQLISLLLHKKINSFLKISLLNMSNQFINLFRLKKKFNLFRFYAVDRILEWFRFRRSYCTKHFTTIKFWSCLYMLHCLTFWYCKIYQYIFLWEHPSSNLPALLVSKKKLQQNSVNENITDSLFSPLILISQGDRYLQHKCSRNIRQHFFLKSSYTFWVYQ